MNAKINLRGLIIAIFVSAIFMVTMNSLMVKASDPDGQKIVCSEGTCVVSNSKNKFLRKGCKPKTGHTCHLGDGGGIKLPEIL